MRLVSLASQIGRRSKRHFLLFSGAWDLRPYHARGGIQEEKVHYSS
jgi:hypothetical protein